MQATFPTHREYLSVQKNPHSVRVMSFFLQVDLRYYLQLEVAAGPWLAQRLRFIFFCIHDERK